MTLLSNDSEIKQWSQKAFTPVASFLVKDHKKPPWRSAQSHGAFQLSGRLFGGGGGGLIDSEALGLKRGRGAPFGQRFYELVGTCY